MEITLRMLLEQLEHCEITIYKQELMDSAYRNVELLPKNRCSLSSDVVYVTDVYWDECTAPYFCMESHEYDVCILLVGEDNTFANAVAASLKSDEEMSVILNRIVNAYFRYIEWDNRLNTCLIRGGEIHELMEIGREMLRNPFELHDPSLKLVSAAPNCATDDLLFTEITQQGYLTIETIKKLNEVSFFPEDDRKHPSPVLIYEKGHSPISSYTQLFNRLDLDGVIVGILYMVFSETEYSSVQQKLLLHLGDKLIAYLRSHTQQQKANTIGYEFLMKDLISRRETEIEGIKARAFALEIPYEADFCFLSISLPDGLKDPIEYVIDTLAHVHRSAKVILFGREILLLLYFEGREEQNETIYQTCLKKIHGFAVREDLVCGVSLRFYALDGMADACDQARQARELGGRLKKSSFAEEFSLLPPVSGTVMYFYEDYAAYHMIREACDHILYRQLCSQELLHLLDFVRKAGTNHIRVLYCFLDCNCHFQKTAEILHMHKNNVIYHIRRIEKMLDHSLDDAEFRLRLQQSFQILFLMEAPDAAPTE